MENNFKKKKKNDHSALFSNNIKPAVIKPEIFLIIFYQENDVKAIYYNKIIVIYKKIIT